MGDIRGSCCVKMRRNKKGGYDFPTGTAKILIDDIEKVIVFMSVNEVDGFNLNKSSSFRAQGMSSKYWYCIEDYPESHHMG